MSKATLIKGAEWLAENAYLPPGLHRLLTAAGLAGGLYVGREMMDVVTAHKAADNSDLLRENTMAILRPIHGTMRYNAYSDAASDRWKAVIDGFAPMIFGGVGAYLGSKHFFYGKPPQFFFRNAEAFNPGIHALAPKIAAATKAGASAADVHGFTLDVAETAANLAQSNATGKLAAGSFAAGSPFGTHLFGAFFPLNNGMSAVRFQQVARNINFPFAGPLNRWLGNRGGGGSLQLRQALQDMVKWAETGISSGAPREAWAHTDELRRRAKDALQAFENVSPADEARMMQAIEKVIDGAEKHVSGISNPKAKAKALTDYLKGELPDAPHGFLGVPFEKLLIEHGFKKHLATASIGDNGPFRLFSRMLGSIKEERKVETAWREHLKQVHGFTDADFGETLIKAETGKVLAASAAAVGMAGIGLAAGQAHHDKAEHIQHTAAGAGTSRVDQAQAHHKSKQQHGGNVLDWINDKPLDVMHWMSRVVIAPPSMHRLMNAAYLSLALWGGMKGANVLAGRNLQWLKSKNNVESLVSIEKVWEPFKPLHGLLSYNPNSHLMADRVKQVAHHLIPVGLGAVGTFTGSHLFFRDRIKKLEKAEYLEDYADKAGMEQSKFYAGATAITSIFNTGSGLHLMPVFNYSSNLHNRYLLASGHQIALPVLGEIWSGNPGLFPWGVKRTLNYTSTYLARNPEEFPQLLPALSHAIIGKLYPHLSKTEMGQKERALMEEIYAVRDPFLEHGKIDASKVPELEKTMKAMLTEQGLEQTLLKIGLNPAQANLASNGVSGAIANAVGSKGAVETIQREYQGKFASRLQHHKESAPAAPKERAPNQPHQSFTDKLLQGSTEPELPALA